MTFGPDTCFSGIVLPGLSVVVCPSRLRGSRRNARRELLVLLQLGHRAVIVEVLHRHGRRERRDAAEVIDVVVAHDEVIDLRQPARDRAPP